MKTYRVVVTDDAKQDFRRYRDYLIYVNVPLVPATKKTIFEYDKVVNAA